MKMFGKTKEIFIEIAHRNQQIVPAALHLNNYKNDKRKFSTL